MSTRAAIASGLVTAALVLAVVWVFEISLSPEPGSGFVTLCPHDEDGGEEEWIVPIGAVARITLRAAEEREPFGFSLPAP